MPRFRPGGYYRRDAGRASAATPEFLQQVEELERNRDVKGLSNLIYRTNRPEKIEPAATALGEIGTSDAKAELLGYLVQLQVVSPNRILPGPLLERTWQNKLDMH